MYTRAFFNTTFLVFFSALFVHASIVEGLLEASEANTYLLSYRRSGTHMLGYTISFLTKRPFGDGRFDVATGVDAKKPRVYQIHNVSCAQSWFGLKADPTNDYLILILRNYKECMMREFLDDYQKVLAHLNDPSDDIESLRYFENLKNYDEWNPKKRLLICYEDFIKDPSCDLVRLLEFLGASDDYLKEFLEKAL